MRWLLILLMTSCAPAYAGGHADRDDWGDPMPVPELHALDDEEGVVIFYTNQLTFGEEKDFYTFETHIGTVVVRITRVPENCGESSCPDKAEIQSLPDGFIAIPSAVTVEERERAEMLIRPYSGG